MLNRRWIKEKKESECCINVIMREIACTDCDNPLGKKSKLILFYFF